MPNGPIKIHFGANDCGGVDRRIRKIGVNECVAPVFDGKFLASNIRPRANSFNSRLPENALSVMLRTKF